MYFTISSFIMSVLWCDIFTILFYVFIHKKKLILNLSVYPLLLLIMLCPSRLALNIEFPFTTVTYSNTIYPKINNVKKNLSKIRMAHILLFFLVL